MTEAAAATKVRWDWWIYAAILLAALQAAAYLVPQGRPGGLAGVMWWSFGLEVFPGAAGPLLVVALLWSAVRRPFRRPHRMVGFALLAAVFLSRFAFRVYPSSHDGAPSKVRFRLPLDGPVTVGWGGGSPDINYHVVAPDQRWAYDLLVSRDGKTHAGDGKKLEDFYCYGMPVRAPVTGTVRSVLDGRPEMPPGQQGGEPAGGNHVCIEVAPAEFLYLCHMKPRSIRVKAGDKVKEGQVLGLTGNSGNTSEPHVHVHLQDTPIDFVGEGIPLYFHHYLLDGRLVERGIPTGGEKRQIVENTDGQAGSSPISRSGRLNAVHAR